MRHIANALTLTIPWAIIGGSNALIHTAGEEEAPPPQAQLDEARTKWTSQGITDYDYQYAESCSECPDSVSRTKAVRVRNGTVVLVEYYLPFDRENGETVPQEAIDRVRSVEELFDAVQGAIDANASLINVGYDWEYGHPKFVDIDYYDEMGDDDLLIRINGLVPLPVQMERQTSLDAARDLWDTFQLDDYDYFYQRICFCIPLYTKLMKVEVRAGLVESAYFEEDGSPAGQDVLSWLKTIDQLFDQIQDAIDRMSYKMDVEYDSTMGYPTKINIDYEEMMADEELYVTTRDLVAVDVSEQSSPPIAECPVQEPDPNSSCGSFADGLSCSYGDECCCGSCSDSYRCHCLGRRWACLNTDYCLAAFPCETDEDCGAHLGGDRECSSSGECCEMADDGGNAGTGTNGSNGTTGGNVTSPDNNATVNASGHNNATNDTFTNTPDNATTNATEEAQNVSLAAKSPDFNTMSEPTSSSSSSAVALISRSVVSPVALLVAGFAALCLVSL